MDRDKKKDFLKMLHDNRSYVAALESIESAADRKKVKAFAEDLFLNLVEGLAAGARLVQENPEKVAEIEAGRIPKK